MRSAGGLGRHSGCRGTLLPYRPGALHPGRPRSTTDLRRLRHHPALPAARRVLPHRHLAWRPHPPVVAGAGVRGSQLPRLHPCPAEQALRARRRGAGPRSPGAHPAGRIHRRRHVATVQGHRVTLQVGTQAAAHRGLRQRAPPCGVPEPAVQAGRIRGSPGAGRTRPLHRGVPPPGGIPHRARRVGAPGADPPLPVPEDRQAPQRAATPARQKLAAPAVRAPDRRVALEPARTGHARQPQPVEGAPGQRRAACAGQRTDLQLPLPVAVRPQRTDCHPAQQSRPRRPRSAPVCRLRTQGRQDRVHQPRHRPGPGRGHPDPGAEPQPGGGRRNPVGALPGQPERPGVAGFRPAQAHTPAHRTARLVPPQWRDRRQHPPVAAPRQQRPQRVRAVQPARQPAARRAAAPAAGQRGGPVACRRTGRDAAAGQRRRRPAQGPQPAQRPPDHGPHRLTGLFRRARESGADPRPGQPEQLERADGQPLRRPQRPA